MVGDYMKDARERRMAADSTDKRRCVRVDLLLRTLLRFGTAAAEERGNVLVCRVTIYTVVSVPDPEFVTPPAFPTNDFLSGL